ncbi:tyrosine-type recombinase/integrase [Rathayibacter festucae]|uniref:Site-specific integrase n=1 Tax=Rathayibacter festucae DSM 15932 TaxID=1328866 RepID=A0A3Q9UZD6_9MICO|nr:site-specific integrase [Rathayibacter festucae]AZZ52815.1 site-specific integrase [Rathayibacter festucae DSM 15932]
MATAHDNQGRAYRPGRLSWGSIKEIRVQGKRKADGTTTRGKARFQASYLRKAPTDPAGGKRVYASGSFDTRTDALGWLDQESARTARGTIDPDRLRPAFVPQTFRQFADAYVETRRHPRNGAAIKPSTIAGYHRLIETRMRPFHALDLADVTPDLVRSWYTSETTTGRLTQAARAYGLLRAILAQAVDDGRLPKNPAAIRGASKAKTGKNVSPPTDAELAIITATIDPRFSLLIEVAAWGALRYGELTELRRGDVEFSAPGDDALAVVHVTRAVTQPTSGGFVVGTPKSSAGIRSVALPSILTPALRRHLAALHLGEEALLWPSTKDPELHLSNGAFYGFWIAAREAAGRADMPFHALRHYGLTRYARAGATTKDLMSRAGHSDVTTAMRYQHAAVERDAELAARMTE